MDNLIIMCFYSQHKYWCKASKEILIQLFNKKIVSISLKHWIFFRRGVLKVMGDPFNQWRNLPKRHKACKKYRGRLG